MKKFYFILLTLMLGVAGMTYLYFSNLEQESSATDNSLNIVSTSAPVIFSFENDKSFYDILSGQNIIDNILGNDKSKLLRSLRKNIITNSNINSIIDGEKVIIGFVPGQTNSIDFVIATQTKEKSIDVTLLNQLNAEIKKQGNLHQINYGDSIQFYLAINQQSILLSNSAEALNKIGSEKAQKNDFSDYIRENNRVSKNTLANAYINYNQLPSLLKNILNTKLIGELSIFNKQDTYASLNYNFSSDKLLLNGYTDLKNDQNYFKLFVNQKEQKITIDQFFPEQTANYALFNIDDYGKWHETLKNWQKSNKEDSKIEQQHKAINEKYRIDITQTFPQYFNKQLAVLQLKSGEKLGVIEIKNGDKLGQLLLDLSSEYAPDIRIFKESKLLYNFFGEPFKKFERPFYTIINNHFVVANYASSIQVFLNAYKNDHLLISDSDYMHFKDQTPSSATIAFYVNNKNSNNIFGRNLKPAYYKQYKAKNGVRDYNAFGYQLSADNGKFMSNIILLKNHPKIDTDSLLNE